MTRLKVSLSAKQNVFDSVFSAKFTQTLNVSFGQYMQKQKLAFYFASGGEVNTLLKSHDWNLYLYIV